MNRLVPYACACLSLLSAGCGGDRARAPEVDGGSRTDGGRDAAGIDAAGSDAALDDAGAADGAMSPDAASCDVDGDFVEGAQCGGPDCCDRGDEGGLGCSPETAPRVRPGVSEEWHVRRLPTSAPIRLLVDAAGVLHGTVRHEDSSTYVTYADGTWSTDRIDGHPRGPDLAMGPDGALHAVYGGETSVVTWAASLHHATRVDGAWISERVNDSVDQGHYTAIAVDGSGVVHVVHSDLIGTRRGSTTVWLPRNLFHSTNAGGTWTTDTVAGWPETPGIRGVAAGNDGNVHIAYYEQEEAVLRYRRRGASLLDEVIGNAVPGRVSVLVDAAERPHVLFSSAAGVQHAVRDGDSWTVETVHPVPAMAGMLSGGMTFDATGAPHFCVGGEGEARYVQRTASGYVAETIAPIGGPGSCQVVVAPDGALHVTFGLYERGYHAFREASPGLDVDCDGAD